MNQTEFKNMLESKSKLKESLFIRGFLVTDSKPTDMNSFPFYGNWRLEEHCGYYFMAHSLTGMNIIEDDRDNCYFILGHAYNPFTMETCEKEILRYIAEAKDKEAFMNRFHELTGVFVFGCIRRGKLRFMVDPSGMQSACCGIINKTFYLTSHAQLVGDLCNLEMDSFVKELIQYKWYGRVMGPYLPADLTPFSELKRVVPSIEYVVDGKIKHKRYWPLNLESVVTDSEEYGKIIEEAAEILKNNMSLVARKWNRPWISMTGGIDSNTTFAAGNGNYERFETFSYISAEKEIPDANAAKKIAEHFGLVHHEYHIPENSDDLEDFEEIRELLRHNNGYIAELYDNEARKKIYLKEHTECDVEVKSWVSETIRAYWYKHYGRKKMPSLSPKLFRNLYKIFIFNRPLAHKIDKLFAKYIKEYEYEKIPNNYTIADMHYNEVTWGSWGGLNISEMKYDFDITFIYNNRRFFDLMFRVPLEKRISDQHHLDMKRMLNKELSDMNIRVVNLKETNFRAFALNVIFTINMILPF